MTDSYKIMISVPKWLKTIDMKKFVEDGMFLQMKITLIIYQKRIHLLQQLMVAPSQVGQWHPTIAKTFWFQASFVYTKPSTPRIWRSTIRGHLLLQAQTMAVGIEFVLYMAEMARFLVVFFKFRKSRKWQAKVWRMNEETRYWQYFCENLRRWLSRIQFCYRWIGESRRRSTVTDGMCRDNTSKDPFSRCEKCKNSGYRLIGRREDKFGLQHEENLELRMLWWHSTIRRPTPMTTWHPRPTQCTWNATPDKWTCTLSSC